MKIFTLLICIVLLTSCNSNNVINKSYTNDNLNLIGTWKCSEMRNHRGEKIETYNHGFGEIKAGGPQIRLNENGTYEKIFTPTNTDSGFWKLNQELMTIEYDLYIDSTDWIGKDLIKKGLAVRQKDGNYYERITDEILKLNEDEMILNKRGNQLVYNKQETEHNK